MTLARTIAVAALAATLATPAAAGTVRIRARLVATSIAPGARGKAILVVRTQPKGSQARLALFVRRLGPSETFAVAVAAVPIGSLETTGLGSGRARFRTHPRARRDQLLGVDPRGRRLAALDAMGREVLGTDVPGDGVRADTIACCVGDDGEACAELTSDECSDRDGSETSARTCVPDPCAPISPSEPSVRCCIAGACAALPAPVCAGEGGVNLGAGACTADACTTTVPPGEPTFNCCVPDPDDPDPEDPALTCEALTAAQCAAAGGRAMGEGDCASDPC